VIAATLQKQARLDAVNAFGLFLSVEISWALRAERGACLSQSTD
jgi:hypothetical protein